MARGIGERVGTLAVGGLITAFCGGAALVSASFVPAAIRTARVSLNNLSNRWWISVPQRLIAYEVAVFTPLFAGANALGAAAVAVLMGSGTLGATFGSDGQGRFTEHQWRNQE